MATKKKTKAIDDGYRGIFEDERAGKGFVRVGKQNKKGKAAVNRINGWIDDAIKPKKAGKKK